jgi:hypothetical protein
MNFFKKLIVNLVFLAIMLVVLYMIFPNIMGAIYKLYYAVLGPALLLLVLILNAMPGKRR